MGIKEVKKRDGDLRRSYKDAYKNDIHFLTKLEKFLEPYQECLIQIKKGGIDENGYKNFLERLTIVKGASDRVHDQRLLLEEVGRLIEPREKFEKVLSGQLRMPRKSPNCTRHWKRCLRLVTYVLFIGAAAAEFACTVVAAVMAAPLVALAIAATIIPTLAGQHWTLSWIEDYETPVTEKEIRLMQVGNQHSFSRLVDIQMLLRAGDTIESLVSHLKSVIKGDENLNIKRHLEKIDALVESASEYKKSKTIKEVSEELRASRSPRGT